MARQPLSPRATVSLLGRYQSPEPFVTQAHNGTVQTVVLNRNIPLSRPLESLRFIWRGRVVVGTANYTTVACEAPQTIIQRIRITGVHKRFTQLIPIDITGATAFAWGRLFGTQGNALYLGATRQALLSSPMGLAGATFGNVGTYDVEVHYYVPVGPMLRGASRIKAIPYLWFAEDWADSLQIQLTLGDNSSFGTPAGGTTVTYTAFGSGAGSPSVEVYPNYAILGVLAGAIDRAVIVRNEVYGVPGVVTALGNALQLSTLQKQRTLNVVVKSGLNLTGVTAGVQVFNTLSDTILDRTQIVVDNKPIRNTPANRVLKEHIAQMFDTIQPQGYLNLSFIEGTHDPLTQFRGDSVLGGSSFVLNSDILSANANNQVSLIQEMQFGEGRGLVQPRA